MARLPARTASTVQRLLDKGDLLWFDLYKPDADELGMLATVFGIHQLAIYDAAQFGQRPKLEDYDDFTQLVAYGVKEGRATTWWRFTSSTPCGTW